LKFCPEAEIWVVFQAREGEVRKAQHTTTSKAVAILQTNQALALKISITSADRKKFLNPALSFFGNTIRSLYEKFKLSSFKIEGGV